MSKIHDKIRKLLSLADRAGTPGEAHAAAAGAARIMARHGLEADDVPVEDDDNAIDGTNPRTVFRVDGRSSMPTWIQQLGIELATICGCYSWKRYIVRQSVTIEAVGRKRDLDTLAVLFPALVHTIKTLTRKKARDVQRRRVPFSPASYSKGLVAGIVRRMQDAQNEVMDEVLRTVRSALRPVDWADRAKEAVDRKIKVARKGRRFDMNSAASGYVDAKMVQVPGEHEAIAGQLSLGDGKEIR